MMTDKELNKAFEKMYMDMITMPDDQCEKMMNRMVNVFMTAQKEKETREIESYKLNDVRRERVM